MTVVSFYDAFDKPDQDNASSKVVELGSVKADKWATRALEAEVTALLTAAPRTRNKQLNLAAFNLGQIVGGGALEEQTVRDALTNAARGVGLDEREIEPSLDSGLYAGMDLPRGPKNDQPTPVIAAFATETEDPVEVANAVFENLPRLDWDELWADDTEEEWIIEPLLPARRLVSLYSAPKVGKSLLMLELAVAVATGRPVLGTTIDRARRVLYVDFENDPRSDIRARLTAMGHGPKDLDNLVLLSFPTLAGLDSEKGSLQLIAAVEAYECEVVIIDTLSRSVDGEENDNDTWISFYRHTGLKLKRAGVALVRLDHSGKDETKGQRGGSAKSGDVDAVWHMTRITEDSYRLECDAQRMPVAEKVLILHRESLPHLHHRVDAEGRSATHRIRVDALVAALDELGLPNSAGRPAASEALKATGHRPGRALGDALKVRKGRFVAATFPCCSGTGTGLQHAQGCSTLQEAVGDA